MDGQRVLYFQIDVNGAGDYSGFQFRGAEIAQAVETHHCFLDIREIEHRALRKLRRTLADRSGGEEPGATDAQAAHRVFRDLEEDHPFRHILRGYFDGDSLEALGMICFFEGSAGLFDIGGGAAASWSLNNLAPRALKGDFAPGFYVKHFLKDMRIALESAEEMKLDLPGLKQAKKLYDEVAARGWSEDGTQALLKLYQAQG